MLKYFCRGNLNKMSDEAAKVASMIMDLLESFMAVFILGMLDMHVYYNYCDGPSLWWTIVGSLFIGAISLILYRAYRISDRLFENKIVKAFFEEKN